MKFLELEVHNFRPYVGPIKIVFASDPVRNVTLIHGLNGAGKTSLLTALNWVLYGKAAVQDEGADSNPIVNKDSISSSSREQPARAVVHLRFSHEGQTYRLTRSATAYREGSHVVQADAKVDLWITNAKANSSTVTEPDIAVRKILPFAIRTFFLFDGDKIGDFTAPGRDSNEKIVKAVNDVLQIKPLRNAVAHLSQLKTVYLKKMQAIPAPRHAETKGLLTIAQVEEKRFKESREDVRTELKVKRERLELLENRIESFIEIQAEAEERRRVKARMEAAESAADDLRSKLAATVLSNLSFPIRDRLAKSVALLGSYKSDHKIPAKIQDYFITELLEDKKCICGRSIEEKSAEEIRLKEILGNLLPGSLQDQATELLTLLKPMLAKSANAEAQISLAFSAIEQNDQLRDQLQARTEQLGGIIDEKALGEAKLAVEERKSLAADLGQLERKEREIDSRILANAARQTEYQKVLEAALATQGKVSSLAAASALFRTLFESMSKIEKELEIKIRHALGSDSTAILQTFAGRAFFENVVVEDNFLLRVLDIRGDDVRGQLSAGQKQITALAFMIGMTQLGGQEAPIVIDTPLARLDENVRIKLVSKLPTLKTQVIFLMTDTEYVGGVVPALKPAVGAEYILTYENMRTEVKQVV